MTIAARLAQAIFRPAPLSVRRRAILLAGVAVFLTGPLLSHLHKSLRTGHGDWLSIYHIAEFSLRTGRLDAGDRREIVQTQRYPPITRPLLMILALPPKAVSAVLSFALFAALYGWCGYRLAESPLNRERSGTVGPPGAGGAPSARTSPAGDAEVSRSRHWLAAVVLCALVAPYIWADLTAGNLTSVLLWSVTAAYVWSGRGWPVRAGVALSIGIMLKMIPAICLVHFLIRRQWRVAWGALAGVVALGLLPSLTIFGPRQLADYHRWWYREEFVKFSPLATIDAPVECLYQNQAVVRTMVRLFTPTNAGHSDRPFYIQVAEPPRWTLKVAYAAVMATSAGALLWVVWKLRREDSPASAAGSYALCVGAMLWLSPWVGSYYFSLAIWPIAVLLARMTAASTAQQRAPAVALGVWVALMSALASQFLRALGITMLGALVLLVGVGAAGLRAGLMDAGHSKAGESI